MGTRKADFPSWIMDLHGARPQTHKCFSSMTYHRTYCLL